ncbi:MAG: hypothetical protein CFK48_11400, partial [Armatimonadetes bacterium CP1_7O]
MEGALQSSAEQPPQIAGNRSHHPKLIFMTEIPIHNDRLVELFTTLCRINSPPRQERALVEYVKGFLRGLGLELREDNAAEIVGGDANNLIATL